MVLRLGALCRFIRMITNEPSDVCLMLLETRWQLCEAWTSNSYCWLHYTLSLSPSRSHVDFLHIVCQCGGLMTKRCSRSVYLLISHLTPTLIPLFNYPVETGSSAAPLKVADRYDNEEVVKEMLAVQTRCVYLVWTSQQNEMLKHFVI